MTTNSKAQSFYSAQLVGSFCTLKKHMPETKTEADAFITHQPSTGGD